MQNTEPHTTFESLVRNIYRRFMCRSHVYGSLVIQNLALDKVQGSHLCAMRLLLHYALYPVWLSHDLQLRINH